MSNTNYAEVIKACDGDEEMINAVVEFEAERMQREKTDEENNVVSIECKWTVCKNGKHLPEKSNNLSEYLTIDEEGCYRILCYLPTIGFFDKDKGYNNILGYVKLSDINVFKVGERNA